mmetsp:Transcript_84153/g.176073  ORF Transcript_84153/g.176073 Transcript_84153/m.176073 type:complete len:313 (-) Transcript_84153:198-1136(-)
MSMSKSEKASATCSTQLRMSWLSASAFSCVALRPSAWRAKRMSPACSKKFGPGPNSMDQPTVPFVSSFGRASARTSIPCFSCKSKPSIWEPFAGFPSSFFDFKRLCFRAKTSTRTGAESSSNLPNNSMIRSLGSYSKTETFTFLMISLAPGSTLYCSIRSEALTTPRQRGCSRVLPRCMALISSTASSSKGAPETSARVRAMNLIFMPGYNQDVGSGLCPNFWPGLLLALVGRSKRLTTCQSGCQRPNLRICVGAKSGGTTVVVTGNVIGVPNTIAYSKGTSVTMLRWLLGKAAVGPLVGPAASGLYLIVHP